MSNPEGLGIPQLYWTDPSVPGPIRQLELSKTAAQSLQAELGRQPTNEEHHEAFQKLLGETVVELTAEQRAEAVIEAKKLIEQLTAFIEKEEGGHNE